MFVTIRACRARGLWRTTPTHGQTGSTTPQQTAGRPINGRESRPTRATRTTCYGHPREEWMSKGCYVENGPVEFMVNGTRQHRTVVDR